MKIWEKNLVYRTLRVYVDWCTGTCFRSFRVEGRENIPKGVPIILAPNHCCTLHDAMVVLKANKNLTAFGARADIFRNKTVREILTFLRMVPLARQRDSISEMKENLHTFDEIVQCIDNGVNFCIFVEGAHRPERGMMPVKRGIFKICEIARKKTGKEVAIVPVGLAYEDFFDNMKDVVVRFGEPIYLSEHPSENSSELLKSRIMSLIQDYPQHRDFPTIVRILLSLLSLPLFAICTTLCCPILIATALLKPKFKDKAWTNTLRFAPKLILLPLLLIIWGVIGGLCLPWWGTILLLVAVLYSQPIWYLLFNLYKSIFSK